MERATVSRQREGGREREKEREMDSNRRGGGRGRGGRGGGGRCTRKKSNGSGGVVVESLAE